MQRQSSQWFIPLLLAGAAGAALWYYWQQVAEPEPIPDVAPPVVETPPQLPEPLHPIEPVATPQSEPGNLVPLPPLNRSDEYFKLELAGLFGDTVEDLLASSRLIERVVATIDNLPRAHIAERIRPVGRLADPFLVDGQDGSGEYTISMANYRRYDALVALVTSADLQQVTDVYRRFYPLFQGAYEDLGYPDSYFNDRLVEVIDHLLETPEVSDPLEVVRPHVLYEFRDAGLEGRSSGQKLLLRMGSEHAGRIKTTLRELRTRITAM